MPVMPVFRMIGSVSSSSWNARRVTKSLTSSCVISTAAVSYTHLDVYKRQLPLHKAVLSCPQNASSCTGNKHGSNNVLFLRKLHTVHHQDIFHLGVRNLFQHFLTVPTTSTKSICFTFSYEASTDVSI